MKKDNLKQAVISLVVGLCVAFVTSFLDGLVELLKTHTQEIVAGGVSTATYLAKAYKG